MVKGLKLSMGAAVTQLGVASKATRQEGNKAKTKAERQQGSV
jgi:hypothetical protein